MQCDQLQVRIDELLDHRREITHDAEVAVHLESCRSCRQLVRGYETMLLAVDLGGEAEPAAQFVQRTVAAAIAPERIRLTPWLLSAAIAASLLIAATAWYFAADGQQRADRSHQGNPDGIGSMHPSAAFMDELNLEFMVQMCQVTGRNLATLPQSVPQAVRRVASHPGTDRVVAHIRPLTEPVGATWEVFLRALPVGSSPATAVPDSDTGYINSRHGRYA